MLMNLWVKDKTTGYVHQVGTDVHDSIEYLGGAVHYVNLQSSASTMDDYEWVGPPDPDEYVSVTPDELFLNRKRIHEGLMQKFMERSKENAE